MATEISLELKSTNPDDSANVKLQVDELKILKKSQVKPFTAATMGMYSPFLIQILPGEKPSALILKSSATTTDLAVSDKPLSITFQPNTIDAVKDAQLNALLASTPKVTLPAVYFCNMPGFPTLEKLTLYVYNTTTHDIELTLYQVKTKV